MLKKLLSLALSAIMVMGMGTTAFASEQQHLQTTGMLETELKVAFDLGLGEDSALLNDTLKSSIANFSQFETKSSSAVFEIRMPKVFTVSKEEAKIYGENYFKDEINTLRKLFNITSDIDDVIFQAIAKDYAQKEDTYVELAKFIDIYENYDYNSKMGHLIENIETNLYAVADQLLSDDDFSTLLSMMPIDTALYPTTEESHIAASSLSTRAITGYSGADARAYAETWAYRTNNTDYGYYADYNNHASPDNNEMWSGGTGNNKRTWSDCANFVSQCLEAGGAPHIKEGLWLPHQNSGNWYYSDSKPSHTWGGANNFQQHWTARVGTHSTSADSQVGDPVSLDWAGDNLADHTVIITTVNGSYTNQMFYAGHTSDQFEADGKSLATLYSSYDKIWIYPVE